MHTKRFFSGIVRDRIVPLMLICALIVGLIGVMPTTGVLADNDDGAITYKLDAEGNNIITYYPKRGEYGQVVYQRKHYTGGNAIHYYTSKFVISFGQVDTGTDLRYLDNSVTVTVSNNGVSVKQGEEDPNLDFYWYDTEPERDKMLTTTYFIDGVVFYNLLANAASQGKTGEMYIHHVFSITGATDNPWYTRNHVTHDSPYYRYSDLLNVNEWENSASTHQSQLDCMNVPVPYVRDIPVYATYYDVATGKTVTQDHAQMKKLTEVWRKDVTPSITVGDKEYKLVAPTSANCIYAWNKDKTLTNFLSLSFNDMKAVAADGNRIGTLTPAGKAKNINTNETYAGTFREGKNNYFTFDLNNLNSERTAWVMNLYIPVQSSAYVKVGYYDTATETRLAAPEDAVPPMAVIGASETFTGIKAPAGYEFNVTAAYPAFHATSDLLSDTTQYKTAVAIKNTSNRTFSESAGTYTISKIPNGRYTTIWIPVRTSVPPEEPNGIPVYAAYVANDGSATLQNLGIVDYVKPGSQYTLAAATNVTYNGNVYTLASASEYGSRSPKAVYSTTDADLSGVKYAGLSTTKTVTRSGNNFSFTASAATANIKAYKIFIPYVKTPGITPTPELTPTPNPDKRTDVIIEYIDSATGVVIKTTEDEYAVRGSLITPKAPSGYVIDPVGKKTPLAISRTGIDRVTLAYDSAKTASGYTNVSFNNINKCTFNVPNGTAAKLAVKAFIPVKRESRQTLVYLKYCIVGNDGKVKTITNPISKGSADFSSETSFTMDSTVEYNGDIYEVSGLARILYGNSSDVLVAKNSDDVLNIPIDGAAVLGSVNDGTLSSSNDSVTFTTADKGDYHVVYVYCSKINASSMLTIHYIDANTGTELKKTSNPNYLNEAFEMWYGINGHLEMGIDIPLETLFESGSKSYQPVYLSKDTDIVQETKHNGACTKGEHKFTYMDTDSSGNYVTTDSYYCLECGVLRRTVPTKGSKTVYDNNSYSDKIHNYSTYKYNTTYTTKADYAKISSSSKSAILAFDGSRTYRMMGQPVFRALVSDDSCRLVLKTTGSSYDYDYEMRLNVGPFSAIPVRRTEITAMTLYVPCVEVDNSAKVTVKYITLKSNGKKDKEVLTTDGGTAEKNKKYSYSGDVTITGSDGKIYNVIGSGDALAYGSTNYITARDDTTNTDGQPVKYDGAGTWTTKKKYSSDEDGILYIPVAPEKEITVKIVYVTLKDDGTIKSTITELDGPPAEEGQKYTYQGSSIVEKDGKTYIATGDGDSASYDGNNYKTGKNDTTNTKGTPVTYDGTDTWTTNKKIPEDIETVTIYIPVKEAKYEVTPPEPDGDITIKYMDPNAKAVIKAKKGTPFDVDTAIPSSEYIYSKVTTNNYLISAGFKNITGLKDAEITVELPYTLYTKDSDGNIIPEKTKSGKVTKTVTVSAPYSYWVLDNAAYYSAKTGTVQNGSVDGKMKADFAASVPEFTYSAAGAVNSHVRFESAVPSTVTMPETKLYGTESSPAVKPTMQKEFAQAYAVTKLPAIEVKNDSVTFNGKTVLDGSWTDAAAKPKTGNVAAPSQISAESPDEQIPAEKANVKYDSTGAMRYVLVSKIGTADDKLDFGIDGVNSVNVHTPVVDSIVVTADNDRYVQAVGADRTKIQLVVGRSDSYGSTGYENSTSDFTVASTHTGKHISAPGYGSSLDTTKYVAKTEVMCNFDVMADVGNDKKENNDILLKSGTWNDISLYGSLYVPEWVKEGDYTVTTRTLAINASGANNGTQKNANTTQSKYIAYSSVDVQVSGKMYALTFTGVNSPASDWKNVFELSSKLKSRYPSKYLDGTFSATFDKNLRYYYTSGLNNELGLLQTAKSGGKTVQKDAKYVYPLLSGSSPVLKGAGMLKSGYTWNFSINTVGRASANDGSTLKVIPTFYWISEDGKTREKVDLYYSAKIDGKTYNYIKIGSATDNANAFTNYAASASMGIPVNEIEFADSLRGEDVSKANIPVYTYGGITLANNTKMFTNETYATLMKTKGSDFTENQLKQLKQTWYFQYGLPNMWHAVPEGYDLAGYVKKNGGCTYKEDFFKKKGYVAIHFDIGLFDKDGNRVLTYINADPELANMWDVEGYANNRTDSLGKDWSFVDGDVIVVRIPGSTTPPGTNIPDPPTNASEDKIVDHLN